MLFELIEQGRPPASLVTVRKIPPHTDEDVRVATILAARVGIPHTILPRPDSYLRSELRKNELTNLCADEHGWYLPVADHLKERADVVFDGLCGAMLSAGSMLEPERVALMETGRHEELAATFCDQREAELLIVLTEAAGRRFSRDRAIARIVAELGQYAGEANPMTSFFFWNRMRREVALAAFGLLRGIRTVHTPFIDHDVFDFLTSLPATMYLDHTFHTQAILRAYPAFADIPFESKGAARLPAHARRTALEVTRYLLGHSGTLVDRRAVLPRLIRGGLRGRSSMIRSLRLPIVIHLTQLEGLAAD